MKRALPVPSSISFNGPGIYEDGYLRVEHDNYYASFGGRHVPMTRTEFLILSRLVQEPGSVIRAEDIWRYVWGDRLAFNIQTLKVNIHRLRRRIEPFKVKIENRPLIGYRLVATLHP